MTRIPDKDRDIMELALYLPMLLTVLQLDQAIIEDSPFKLKQPYLQLIEDTSKQIHKDLYRINKYMFQHKLKVKQIDQDDTFTMFLFIYNGYEEQHNYFNPSIRNKVGELLENYFSNRTASFGNWLKIV